mgnify:CR=1 FL=1
MSNGRAHAALCDALSRMEFKEYKLRPCNSPPATISEWIFARSGAFANRFKELHGGALLIAAAQCCDEHRSKKLVFLRACFVLLNYKQVPTVCRYDLIKARLHINYCLLTSQQGPGHHVVAMQNDEVQAMTRETKPLGASCHFWSTFWPTCTKTSLFRPIWPIPAPDLA